MARREDRNKAIKLRLKGLSYSQIKAKMGLSKGTMSSWLNGYPLSPERIKELRDKNPRRIENFRNTMRVKREKVLNDVYESMKSNIGKLSKRELFLSGFFLYWGEGGKSDRTPTNLTNTDPSMLKFFVRWLILLGVSRNKLKVRLQLYQDMNLKRTIEYWSSELGLPISSFRKPQIKKTKLSDITYKTGFGHGTCSVLYEKRDFHDRIMMGLKYIKDKYCTRA